MYLVSQANIRKKVQQELVYYAQRLKHREKERKGEQSRQNSYKKERQILPQRTSPSTIENDL
jgi:hypothetical protein